ncbi:BcepMu gp16 family phage-associated protein [Acinetobacter colistiniresistens]|uniref:BcepMu gp16 family phage-associated protein n=1 Tax=Acinetobacter colistiniresistens TaxID=280145 RepID=N9PKC6_9GAMM|nr:MULTISPECIES: DNA-binding protein [Acinetobacter]ENX33918.1 BcepMu gp16 family phage-associated protein [Acinetobacter colistiniresistens]
MHLKTPEQVKKEFVDNGIPVSTWAETNGFTSQEVYKVLNGQSKGNYGRAHKIAVALGLKPQPKVTV